MTLLRGDWFYAVLAALDAFFMTRPYLYAIQQDNYRVGEIFKSKRLAVMYLIDIAAQALFIGVWALFYFLQTRAFWGFVTVMFFFIAEFAMYFMEDLPSKKKPLKYTKRAVRCLIFVTLFSATAVMCLFATATARLETLYLRYIVLLLFPLMYPPLFMLATGTINVFERLNNARYKRRAKKRLLANAELVRVAVTGSYGKTSVKNFLTAMLQSVYNVLPTPASYNTPMGISKTVDGLDATYDVFVAEFGARRVGDVKELMSMCKPEYAILTGINSQHLETFRTQENILREKCRVLELPRDGIAVVNSNLRGRIEGRIPKKDPPRIIYAGLDEDAEYAAKDLRMTENGCEFTLVLPEGEYAAYTSLFGRQNVEDIVLAAALAHELGVGIPVLLEAIEGLQPVPHRMQLISGNGICVIDDSFNSNPDGAACALDALSMLDRRKVVLTPGMVELGAKEEEENFKLGRKLASVADLVLLVGMRRTDPIRRGLADGGYAGEIHVYESLDLAQKDFTNRLHVGDALLILNDLPDIYDDRPSKKK